MTATVIPLGIAEGGNPSPFFSGYRCLLQFEGDPLNGVHDVQVDVATGIAIPGDEAICTIIPFHPEYLSAVAPGSKVTLVDGSSIRATGIIQQVTRTLT